MVLRSWVLELRPQAFEFFLPVEAGRTGKFTENAA
jgi:hypothetical protein